MSDANSERWCFAKDDDGHNYLIPASRYNEFQEACDNCNDDLINNEFDQFRCDSLSNYTFTDPKYGK